MKNVKSYVGQTKRVKDMIEQVVLSISGFALVGIAISPTMSFKDRLLYVAMNVIAIALMLIKIHQ